MGLYKVVKAASGSRVHLVLHAERIGYSPYLLNCFFAGGTLRLAALPVKAIE